MRNHRLTIIVLSLCGAVTVAALSPAVRNAAKRSSKWVIVATNAYQDGLRRAGFRSDQVGQDTGSSRTAADIPRMLERINRTFESYAQHLPSSDGWFAGKRVLEVGPGDNLGVALRFVAAGAQRVVAIDKFVPLRSSTFHQQLYGALRAQRLEPERQAIDRALELRGGIRPQRDRLAWVSGIGVEELRETEGPASFDVIVSNAVLEEVYAIDEAFDSMDRLLAPDGYQVHKIDLRDYGMFTRHGYHPLEFLTIPDSLYRYMVESTGQPNRRLIDYYRHKAAALGYRATIYSTLRIGTSEEFRPPREQLCPCERLAEARAMIQDIRPRLLARYRSLSDEDLMVQGILFVAQKPPAASVARRD